MIKGSVFNKVIKLLIVFSLGTFLIVGFLHPTVEISRDLGEQLLTGKITFETHKVLRTNLFSYTYSNFKFIDSQWLSEVIFYLFYQYFGINSLILLNTFLAFIAAAGLYLYVSKKYDWLLIAYASLFYLIILLDRTYIRPEVFSYFFLVLTLILLYKFRGKFTKLIFFLIPIQLLWINIHIYFIIGLFLMGLFLIEGICCFREKYNGKYISILLIVFLASFLVSFINPYGLNSILFPFTYSHNYSFPISENLNFFTIVGLQQGFVYSYFMYTLVCVLFVILFFLNIKKTRVIDWLIVISFMILSLSIVRTISLFAITTFIPFVYIINLTFKKYSVLLHKLGKRIVFYKNLLSVIVIILLIGHILQYYVIQGFGFGSIEEGKTAVNFLIKNNINGPILNSYDIGSYLVYRLYPKQRVFADGRPEAYPSSFYSNVYLPMQENKNIFNDVVNKYQFNAIIIDYPDQQIETLNFLKILTQENNWIPVYLDNTIVIFVKNDSVNKKVIQKYTISQSTYKIPSGYPINTIGTIGNFFNAIGWYNQSANAYEKILIDNPNNCTALGDLLALPQQNNSTSIYSLRYQTYCLK